jgi:hypothetical protein
MIDEPEDARPPPPPPVWPPPWPETGEPGSFADAAARAWTEREAIYRLVYHLEARLDTLERENSRWHQASETDRAAIRRQLGRHVDVLRTVQTRLNMVMVMMISVSLFALAGPDGLRAIADTVTGHGALRFDGIVTLTGAIIPILYPIGRKIFLSVRPETTQQQGARYGD